MLIRSKIPNEPKGRVVSLGPKGVYTFKPNEAGHNVCEVEDRAHIQRLLSITEGYEIYDPNNLGSPEPAVSPGPRTTDKRGDPFAKPVTEMVGEDTAPPSDAELAADRSEREGPNYNGLTRKQLEEAYFKKFKKAPNPRSTDETIIKRLIAGKVS